MPTVRMAYLMLFKTKTELMKVFDVDDGRPGRAFVDGCSEVIKRLEAMVELVKIAEARMLVAAASFFPDGEEEAA